MEQPRQSPSFVLPVALVGLALVLWLVWVAHLVAVVPAFERRFADDHVKLPSATIVTIEQARWAVKYWHVVLLVAAPLGAVTVAVGLLLRKTTGRWFSVLWLVLMVAPPVACLGMLWWSLWLA
jgi:type II secretory pathway component PulF